MTVSPRSRALPESILCAVRRLRRPVRIGGLIALILALVVATSPSALAQVRPEVLDRVVPAAVQIAIMFRVTSNGVTESRFQPMGSGTVVSATGHILTNWHVVNMAEHRATLDAFEAQAAAQGQQLSFTLDEQNVLILTSDGLTPPEPHYFAKLAVADEALDLAVLQVTEDDAGPVYPTTLDLPFVPLGDSNALRLGDPVDIFGYPAISGGVLTYTQGVVSAFQVEGPIGRRAWMATDATMSGGSSGGTAINRDGALIGIPTWGPPLDCRPGDTNGDGRLDAADVGCVPTGGSLEELRPINLAVDLLTRAGMPRATASGGQDQPTVGSIADRLPQVLPLAHSGCFRIETDHVLTFEDLLANFGGTDEARSRLQTWGWQERANRVFACDTPPDGEAGWVDISLHLFADAASAQQAVDYFATVRAEGTSLIPAAAPAIGATPQPSLDPQPMGRSSPST
jgi:hypothetical protein